MRIRNDTKAPQWMMRRIPDEDSSSASTIQVSPIKEVDPEAMSVSMLPASCSPPYCTTQAVQKACSKFVFKKRPSSSRRVVFDEGRNTFHQGANESKARLYFCWNDVDDYFLFKKRALVAAKRVATGEKEHLNTLLGAYEFCCSVPVDAEDRSRKAIFKMNKCIPQEEEDSLTCGMGLERIYLKSMRLNIKERQKLMFTTVKKIQNQNFDEEDDKLDAIRDALKAITLPSKLFALVKAQAVSDECSMSTRGGD